MQGRERTAEEESTQNIGEGFERGMSQSLRETCEMKATSQIHGDLNFQKCVFAKVCAHARYLMCAS